SSKNQCIAVVTDLFFGGNRRKKMLSNYPTK
ncbi:MAG: hypothetical protein ACI85O_001012, partial [Saprospiraceae bacterium]